MTYKAAAVEQVLQLISEGMSATKASDQVGADHGVVGRTVRRWAQDAGHALGDESEDTAKEMRRIAKERYAANRAQLSVRLSEATEHVLTKLLEAEQGRDAKDWSIAVGVLIDKMRLEEGKSTGRQEHVSVDEAYRVLKDAVQSEEPSKEEADAS